jgi:hypothetical protein
MLKEIVATACDIPETAFYLQRFIEVTAQETGMKIEFEDESLCTDSWVLDIITDRDYKKRIE